MCVFILPLFILATLPETNSKFAPKNGWLEYFRLSYWGCPFSGAFAVSFSNPTGLPTNQEPEGGRQGSVYDALPTTVEETTEAPMDVPMGEVEERLRCHNERKIYRCFQK